MITKKDNLAIEDYYNKLQILYTLVYSKGTDALHYGFWKKDTKSISEELLNPIKFICECLEIDKKDVVLDAGCGVGGTSIYIAKNYETKVFGITLSDVQLKISKQKSLKSKVADLTNFSKQDFTKTNFKDNSFSKIFGLESICYAPKKIDFLNEAFRLLKKDGKIAIADAFLIRTNFNKKEKEVYKKFLNGWVIPNLSTKDGFYNDLKKAGFRNIKFYDKFKAIKKSRDRIYRIGMIGYLLSLFLYKMRIIPRIIHNNTLTCIVQKKLFCEGNNLATYGVFVAQK